MPRDTHPAPSGVPRFFAPPAALGLDLASIAQCHDAALLWRAARELVLPGRVAEATQRRILRRYLWRIE